MVTHMIVATFSTKKVISSCNPTARKKKAIKKTLKGISDFPNQRVALSFPIIIPAANAPNAGERPNHAVIHAMPKQILKPIKTCNS